MGILSILQCLPPLILSHSQPFIFIIDHHTSGMHHLGMMMHYHHLIVYQVIIITHYDHHHQSNIVRSFIHPNHSFIHSSIQRSKHVSVRMTRLVSWRTHCHSYIAIILSIKQTMMLWYIPL